MFVMTDSTSANVRRSVDQPLPARDEFGPLPRGIHHLGMTVPDIDVATTFLRAALGARVCYDGVTAQDTPREGAELERILGLPPGSKIRASAWCASAPAPGWSCSRSRRPPINPRPR